MQKIIIFVALSFVLISCNNQAKNIENKEENYNNFYIIFL
jgi:hypothetical protein